MTQPNLLYLSNLIGVIALSATSRVCFGTKQIASWLFVMTQPNLLYLSNLIGAITCRYIHIIMPQFYQWTCPDPIFDKAAGHARKIWCLGTRLATYQDILSDQAFHSGENTLRCVMNPYRHTTLAPNLLASFFKCKHEKAAGGSTTDWNRSCCMKSHSLPDVGRGGGGGGGENKYVYYGNSLEVGAQ